MCKSEKTIQYTFEMSFKLKIVIVSINSAADSETSCQNGQVRFYDLLAQTEIWFYTEMHVHDMSKF